MKQIMIIDDEEPFTRLCKMNLEASDAYHITIVNDPLNAMHMISEVKPDLIFLDVIMPGINGPDLVGKIREDDAAKEIPIIFLSASVVKMGEDTPLVHTGEGTFRTLTNPYLRELPVLEKPVTPELMMQTIARYT